MHKNRVQQARFIEFYHVKNFSAQYEYIMRQV